MHGEIIVFGPPGEEQSGPVVKAVVGASRRVDWGPGLLAIGEYHYSGFGAATGDGLAEALADPVFLARYRRGDIQVLGRHALALMASAEFSPSLSAVGQWVQNPVDRSGVIATTVAITRSDRTSFVVAMYLPFGASPDGARIRSEYGSAGPTAFAQWRYYR